MALERKIGLVQATALNMIDMVGIGPFIVMAGVIQAMNGPACMIAWLFGALLSLMDAFVWSELGAAMPQAGGTYVFLRETYGSQRWGKVMSFLFIWQTTIQAPLVAASASIGFSNYSLYLFKGAAWYESMKTIPVVDVMLFGNAIHLSQADILQKSIAGLVVVVVIFLLYRRIESIGKLSIVLWITVIATMLWLILSGMTHFNPAYVFDGSFQDIQFNELFFTGLGVAMGKTVYSYLGYYNVCHLGSEITQPEKNIPRSMFISVIGIALLYCAMQMSVLGVIPWREGMNAPFIASLFFERIYGPGVAQIATGLILIIAFSSLFAVVLGYSRIPYAAAKDGNFFAVFGKEHPVKHFPYVSLLVLGGIAFVFSLLFKLQEVIDGILTMRIVIQFIGQAVGLMLLRRKIRAGELSLRLPFKMPWYPLPLIFTILAWAWLFSMRSAVAIQWGLSMLGLGILFYTVYAFMQGRFPFNGSYQHKA